VVNNQLALFALTFCADDFETARHVGGAAAWWYVEVIKEIYANDWRGTPLDKVPASYRAHVEARRAGSSGAGNFSAALPAPDRIQEGIDAWIERDLPALEARGARVIASIWGRTVEEFVAAASPLKAVAHRLTAVEINLSCPNVEARGDVFAHSEGETRAATLAVVDALGGSVPTFAKLSPNVTDVVAIADAALDAGATGLTLVNSVMGLLIDARRRTPRLGAGAGGLTGAPIKPIALRVVWDVARAHPGGGSRSRHRRTRTVRSPCR